MHDLEVAPHVVDILPEVGVVADGDLFGAFDVVHAVVVVAGVDDVPVAHHLPARGGAAESGRDDFVGIVRRGRVEQQLHVPHVVLPEHDLEVIVVEVFVGVGGRLVVDEESASGAGVRQLGSSAVDGVAGEAAQLIGGLQPRQASDIIAVVRDPPDLAGAEADCVRAQARIGRDVAAVFPDRVVKGGFRGFPGSLASITAVLRRKSLLTMAPDPAAGTLAQPPAGEGESLMRTSAFSPSARNKPMKRTRQSPSGCLSVSPSA